MRRVLVPLDGSELSASIIPHARRLAGPDGELILVHDVVNTARDPETGERSECAALDLSQDYLDEQANLLRVDGVNVRAETLVIFDVARGIDDAARIFNADMMACATHGRRRLGRLFRGSVAWNAMAHSPVPVLLRHSEDSDGWDPSPVIERRIMVPLDGSEYGDRALPLAAELAKEWDAKVYLTQVVPDPYPSGPNGAHGMMPLDIRRDMHEVKNRLNELAARFPGDTQTHVSCGKVPDELVEDVDAWGITDIVMTSHGRTGLSRVIVGSVADALIQRLHCPIIIIPALAAQDISAPDKSEIEIPAGVE